ncbi:MAG: homocysteine S-methyltransferase family protein [Alphaproteobacteria bacterium]|nr:homocysteine S-methyltransferase family protein [Alphaproteobacteria bacterium]
MRTPRISELEDLIAKRIVILDGAMGTTLQKHRFSEAQFRGARFKDWPRQLQGNNDLLSLSQPDAVRDAHLGFFRAGSDIVETNTFSSTAVAQADYGMEDLVFELNKTSARIANEAARIAESEDGRPRFVAGALGPTNRTASISPDVNDPGFRAITFEQLHAAYAEQLRGLVEGGVDLIMIETIFDTLNAKAALFAVDDVAAETRLDLRVIISGTISDKSGRLLSGQTPEAFWVSMKHARPLAFGLNCGLGAKELRNYVADLARVADVPICVYPNAGLPNEMGEYDQHPDETGELLGLYARQGFINIVGGCCGTTHAHIKAIADSVRGVEPRHLHHDDRT